MLVFTNFWSFLAKSLKVLCSKFEKKSEKKNKKNYFFRNFYSGPLDRFLRTMLKVFEENLKRFKTWKKYKATSGSCGHAEVSFHKFLKFFGQKSESILLKIRKISEKKNKKNYFFRKFYSGHVDGSLRTMPNVSAENPKRFKILEKVFESQTVPLDT